jgi:alginate O-acetyltransferase complex protein AlgI
LPFDTVTFLFEFLPALLAVFFLVRGLGVLVGASATAMARASLLVLLAASVWIVAQSRPGWLLLGASALTLMVAALIERERAARPQGGAATGWLVAGVTINVAAFAIARAQVEGRAFAFVGAVVISCHAIAYLIDVYRGEATAAQPLVSALYLVQFPVLPAGPIVRSRDFSRQHLLLQDGIGLSAFTYGMRRLIIGLVKIVLIARTLGGPVDAIFALPAARLSLDAAWLGAIGFALELYFQCSGYADIAIGLGRMFGLRYPENFRRPYVADSAREFWRRWNITAITWLRDYLSLPIAGRDAPTPRLFLNIVLGFCLVGLLHGAGTNVVVWAMYSGVWLALEALGLGARLERLPAPLRHLYLLLVIVVGWVILRAETTTHAVVFLETMAGLQGTTMVTATRYLTLPVWAALVVAIVGAGPLIPWISRWRVTLDAVTAAVVMMLTAVSLFVWRGGTLVAEAIRPLRGRKPGGGRPPS